MKVLELGSILISLIGFLMKILGLNGGNELLMMGMTLLALVYLILGFFLFNNIQLRKIFRRAAYVGISSGRIVGAIGVGGFLFTTIIGLLFRLLILSGALEMIAIGVTGLIITLFAAVIIFILKKKNIDSFYKKVFVKGGIAVILGIILYLTPASSLIRFFHRGDPAYAEIFVKAVENPYDEQIQKEFEEARDQKYK